MIYNIAVSIYLILFTWSGLFDILVTGKFRIKLASHSVELKLNEHTIFWHLSSVSFACFLYLTFCRRKPNLTWNIDHPPHQHELTAHSYTSQNHCCFLSSCLTWHLDLDLIFLPTSSWNILKFSRLKYNQHHDFLQLSLIRIKYALFCYYIWTHYKTHSKCFNCCDKDGENEIIPD